MAQAQPAAEPFFLPSARGPLFALYHAPAGAGRGALLYVHPFGDEMNKSRRMAALQARRLAAEGMAVLQLDLYGCGDSAGEFADARWEHWLDDLSAGCAWLQHRTGMTPGLWGLRLGALLALDYARCAAYPAPRLVLWQPVSSGAAFLTQFLRLRSAGDVLRGGAVEGTRALRDTLMGGSVLEVGGYQLAPQLAAAIEGIDASKLVPSAPADWFDIGPGERPLSPASERIAAAWRDGGARVNLHGVRGPAFWSSQEIVDCPPLLDATAASLAEEAHA